MKLLIETRWISVPVYSLVALFCVIASIGVVIVSRAIIVVLQLRSYVREVRP